VLKVHRDLEEMKVLWVLPENRDVQDLPDHVEEMVEMVAQVFLVHKDHVVNVE
jgi:hypothetical protein